MHAQTEYRYNRLTWAEMNDAIAMQKVITYPVRFNDYWGRWTDLGVHGDATTATAEKGEVIFEAAVTGIMELVEAWQQWPIAERMDQHTWKPVAQSSVNVDVHCDRI